MLLFTHMSIRGCSHMILSFLGWVWIPSPPLVMKNHLPLFIGEFFFVVAPNTPCHTKSLFSWHPLPPRHTKFLFAQPPPPLHSHYEKSLFGSFGVWHNLLKAPSPNDHTTIFNIKIYNRSLITIQKPVCHPQHTILSYLPTQWSLRDSRHINSTNINKIVTLSWPLTNKPEVSTKKGGL